MKKLLFYVFLLSGSLMAITSCTNDAINEPVNTARDYNTDAQILSRFVDINKVAGTYFLNESKKLSAMSYVTDKDWKELQQVSSAHKTRFEADLQTLNAQLAAAAQDPNVSQIVFHTYSETYIKDLKHDAPVSIAKSTVQDLPAARSSYGRLSLLYNTKQYMSFNAGRTVRMNVSLLLGGYTYYYFTIKCNTDATKSPNGPTWGNDSQVVVMSGSTSMDNFAFTWTAQSSDTRIYWDFEGIKYAPQALSGQITAEFMD